MQNFSSVLLIQLKLGIFMATKKEKNRQPKLEEILEKERKSKTLPAT